MLVPSNFADSYMTRAADFADRRLARQCSGIPLAATGAAVFGVLSVKCLRI